MQIYQVVPHRKEKVKYHASCHGLHTLALFYLQVEFIANTIQKPYMVPNPSFQKTTTHADSGE